MYCSYYGIHYLYELYNVRQYNILRISFARRRRWWWTNDITILYTTKTHLNRHATAGVPDHYILPTLVYYIICIIYAYIGVNKIWPMHSWSSMRGGGTLLFGPIRFASSAAHKSPRQSLVLQQRILTFCCTLIIYISHNIIVLVQCSSTRIVSIEGFFFYYFSRSVLSLRNTLMYVLNRYLRITKNYIICNHVVNKTIRYLYIKQRIYTI